MWLRGEYDQCRCAGSYWIKYLGPIGDRNRQYGFVHHLGFADRVDQREPDERSEGQRIDLDVVLSQRHLVYGLRGLERNRADERHA